MLMEVHGTLRCPSCDHGNRAERRFCTQCGAALAAVCPSCGVASQPGDKFCGGCGKRLATVAPASGAPMPTLPSERPLRSAEMRRIRPFPSPFAKKGLHVAYLLKKRAAVRCHAWRAHGSSPLA